MYGIELIKELTAIFKPGFLEIILNGRRTRSILKVLRILTLLPASLKETEISETKECHVEEELRKEKYYRTLSLGIWYCQNS